MPKRPRMKDCARVTVYLPGATSPYTVLVIKPGEVIKLSELVSLLGDRAEMGVGATLVQAFDNASLKLASPTEDTNALEARLAALPRVGLARPPSR